MTKSKAFNQSRQLTIDFTENTYCEANIFFRQLTVTNSADYKRNLRLVFFQDFHLYGDGVGDTGFYRQDIQAVIHYKKSVFFLLGLLYGEKKPRMDDFDISEKAAVSWEMPQHPIHQGEVTSSLAVNLDIEPGSSKEVTFYMVAADNLDNVCNLQTEFLQKGVGPHLKHTQMCQRGWLASVTTDLSPMPENIQELYKRSLLIIKTQVDKHGAIIAANDSDNINFNKDTYSYMWPRDGALVAKTMIKAGFAEFIKPFFTFCERVLFSEGCLLHKYNPDGTLGSSWHPWVVNGKQSLPIQEDETALVLDALWEYYQVTNDKEFIKKLYPTLIQPMGNFLSRYRYDNGLPKESYDLWEERRGIFTFTTSAVLSGLKAAQKLGQIVADKEFCQRCQLGFDPVLAIFTSAFYKSDPGYFRRGVSYESGEITYDDALDASVYGVFEFGVLAANDPMVVATMNKVKEWLWVKTDVGGVARYANDYYYQKSNDIDKVPGNPWFICTLWYAKWLIAKAKSKEDLNQALILINWVGDHALPSGVLSEQVHPLFGKPLSVSPLTWSHAEFVDTITNYCKKYKQLI